MPCFYPPNYSVTKIVTEPKIEISISSSLINRLNLSYQEAALLYYRATSQLFIPHCILIAKDNRLEIVDSDQIDEALEMTLLSSFTFDHKWTSSPLRQFQQSTEAFMSYFVSILTVEVVKQKMNCLNIEWMLFEHEEYAKAGEIARSITADYVTFNKEVQEVTIIYGALEE